jgi:hypothetical protein
VRWNTFLQDYDFEITHIPGKNNAVADLLSQRKDFEGGVNPSPSITILPEQLFACKIYQSTRTYLEDNPETQCIILYDIHDTPIGGHVTSWDTDSVPGSYSCPLAIGIREGNRETRGEEVMARRGKERC